MLLEETEVEKELEHVWSHRPSAGLPETSGPRTGLLLQMPRVWVDRGPRAPNLLTLNSLPRSWRELPLWKLLPLAQAALQGRAPGKPTWVCSGSCSVAQFSGDPSSLSGHHGHPVERATPAAWRGPSRPACPQEPRSPKLPVQRQLWVRGWGLVWWLSRICCTSCSTEKPELLLPLLQVHLMPWTVERGAEGPLEAQGRGGTWALSQGSPLSAGRLAPGAN